MRKEYHSSNVRFCMDDENQRRTWEYLQSITRKEGSYGKILSDAFVQILDGNHAIEQGAFQQNNMSLLLYGHPGCGKTSAAKYIASQLGLPLVVARLDTLISSLLGNTAKNIHKIFEFAKKQPCVLFLDEFDAIAKARDEHCQ